MKKVTAMIMGFILIALVCMPVATAAITSADCCRNSGQRQLP